MKPLKLINLRILEPKNLEKGIYGGFTSAYAS
jgi:hypothetical protein